MLRINRYSLENSSIVKKDQNYGSRRKIARFIGVAILLIGVFSGIVFPILGSLMASIGLIGIFLLDIAVSLAIFKYYKNLKPTLAKRTAFFRLFHTLLLGIGIGYHIQGNISMFNKFFGIGLIGFGIHLILLSSLLHQHHSNRWIKYSLKALLIIAGIGYIIQHMVTLLLPSAIHLTTWVESVFIIPMIFGEVFYAFWMIVKEDKESV